MKDHPGTLAGLAIAVLVIAADQLVKAWMMALLLDPMRILTVTDFFALAPAMNRGVAFSFFGENSGWGSVVFSALALIVSAILVRWLTQTRRIVMIIALGLIIGGALGNAIDRLRHGAVFDFLYFHAGAYSFPAFNLADSAISVGVALLLLDSLFAKRETAK
jgi:signal peptidase II